MGASTARASWSALAMKVPHSNTPDAFPRKLLIAGESVLFETRPSLWARYWTGLVFFGFFFFVIVGGSILTGQLVFGLVASFILFGIPIALLVLAWRRTAYALTNAHVLRVSGLFSRSLQVAGYDEIQNLTLGSGSTGSITFDTSAKRRGILDRSAGGQKIVWGSLPLSGQVYEFVQSAFAVHTSTLRKDQLRQALVNQTLASTVPCQYCGTLIDAQSIREGGVRCPSCGAPISLA